MGMKKPPPGEGRGLVASRPSRHRDRCGPGQPRAQVTGGAQALGSSVWPCHRVPLVRRDACEFPTGVLFRIVTGGAVGVQVWIQAETDAVCVANLVDCIGWRFHGVVWLMAGGIEKAATPREVAADSSLPMRRSAFYGFRG